MMRTHLSTHRAEGRLGRSTYDQHVATSDTKGNPVSDPKQAHKKKLSAGAWEEARALIWAHRKRLALGMALMVVNRMAGLVLPTTTKFLMDDVVGRQNWALLPP